MKQKKTCELEGFTNCWIETREQVSTVLYDAWWLAGADAALPASERNSQSLTVALQILGAWSLEGEGELPATPAAATPATLREMLDVRLLVWIIKTISEMLNERVNLKNPPAFKSPASP